MNEEKWTKHLSHAELAHMLEEYVRHGIPLRLNCHYSICLDCIDEAILRLKNMNNLVDDGR